MAHEVLIGVIVVTFSVFVATAKGVGSFHWPLDNCEKGHREHAAGDFREEVEQWEVSV